MLYVIYGKNFKKSRENLKKLTEALLKKKPDSNLFKLDSENFSGSQLESLVGGQGLFEQKYIVVLDKCLEDKISKETILDKLDDISFSNNIFVLIEEEIDSKTIKKLEKKAEKIHEHTLKENVVAENNFKIFTLTDALGKRDKKAVWVEYQKALAQGSSAEEIYSMLLWQVRSMVLAGTTKSASEAGLKPFVYSKSKKFASNYSVEEIKNLYKNLVKAYHKSRRGGLGLTEAVEEVLLGV